MKNLRWVTALGFMFFVSGVAFAQKSSRGMDDFDNLIPSATSKANPKALSERIGSSAKSNLIVVNPPAALSTVPKGDSQSRVKLTQKGSESQTSPGNSSGANLSNPTLQNVSGAHSLTITPSLKNSGQ